MLHCLHFVIVTEEGECGNVGASLSFALLKQQLLLLSVLHGGQIKPFFFSYLYIWHI
jgi:hypothetical protein